MKTPPQDDITRRKSLHDALEATARYQLMYVDNLENIQGAASAFYAPLGLPDNQFWDDVPADTSDATIAALLGSWRSMSADEPGGWERAIALSLAWIESGVDLRRIRVALLFAPFRTLDRPVLRTHLDAIAARFPELEVHCQSAWAERLGVDFCAAAANSLVPEMKLLLKAGARINWCDERYRQTALNCAAGHGLTRSVKFLIEQGADLNARNHHDMTPLMCACFKGGKKGSAVALLLIEAGADVIAVREADGKTAIQWALAGCEPDVVQALEQRGATLPKAGFRVHRIDGDKVAILDFPSDE